jgi:hypothetical protein
MIREAVYTRRYPLALRDANSAALASAEGPQLSILARSVLGDDSDPEVVAAAAAQLAAAAAKIAAAKPKAGGLLRTSTRPTPKLLLLLQVSICVHSP